MRFVARPVPDRLRDAVRELWLLDDDGGFHAGLPKPHVELVVSLSGVHWWRASPGAAEHRYAEGWVTPIQDGPRFARAIGRRRLIGARLEPWAAVALFGPLPPGDGSPPPMLRDFLGSEARRLRERLRAAADDDARFALLAGWLGERFASVRVDSRPSGTARVGGLAAAMRVSPRALRRRFASAAGVAPKRWLRLSRLDAVLRDPALADPRQSLARLAAEHGYADQAHLAREVARFTGATPSVLRGRGPGLPPHLLPKS